MMKKRSDEKVVKWFCRQETKCFFCGKPMTSDDAMFVRLSRMFHVGVFQYRHNMFGFGFPCCQDCHSAWSSKFETYLLFRTLTLPLIIVYLPIVCYLCQFKSPFIPICIVALYPLVIWAAKSIYRNALIRAIDVSPVRKLLNRGYVVDVHKPRSVDQKLDLQNRVGQKRMDSWNTTEDMYRWKGFADGCSRQNSRVGHDWHGDLKQFVAFVCMILFLVFYYGVLIFILVESLTYVSDIIVSAGWTGNNEYGAKLAIVIAAAALGAFCHLYVMHLIFLKIKLVDTHRQMLAKAILPTKSDNPKALIRELLAITLRVGLRHSLRVM